MQFQFDLVYLKFGEIFSEWFYCKNYKLIPRFTSMENYLISKKLLDSKLFQFCSPQRRTESEMKWNETENVATRKRDNKETVEPLLDKLTNEEMMQIQLAPQNKKMRF